MGSKLQPKTRVHTSSANPAHPPRFFWIWDVGCEEAGNAKKIKERATLKVEGGAPSRFGDEKRLVIEEKNLRILIVGFFLVWMRDFGVKE
jgi:hypothetical protein